MGRCTRGDMCKFFHGGGGFGGGYAPPPPRDMGVCFDFIKGRCFRRDCKFRHDENGKVEVRPLVGG